MQFFTSILNNNNQRNLLICFVTVTCLLGLGQFFQETILFDRARIEQGHWWQLISGNFTHSNIPHLLLNLCGIWVLLFLFFDTLKVSIFILSTLILAPIIGIGLYLYNPELHYYYGFSGILYGLYLIAATMAVLQKDYFTGFSVALVITAKIFWDFLTGGNQSSAELIGVAVANDAHLYGFIGALIISIALAIIHYSKKIN